MYRSSILAVCRLVNSERLRPRGRRADIERTGAQTFFFWLRITTTCSSSLLSSFPCKSMSKLPYPGTVLFSRGRPCGARDSRPPDPSAWRIAFRASGHVLPDIRYATACGCSRRGIHGRRFHSMLYCSLKPRPDTSFCLRAPCGRFFSCNTGVFVRSVDDACCGSSLDGIGMLLHRRRLICFLVVCVSSGVRRIPKLRPRATNNEKLFVEVACFLKKLPLVAQCFSTSLCFFIVVNKYRCLLPGKNNEYTETNVPAKCRGWRSLRYEFAHGKFVGRKKYRFENETKFKCHSDYVASM